MHVIDVLRAAVAEIEDYTRIQVDVRTGAALAGHAVADVVHLLAELIENATVFSPPTTQVRVQGELVGRGYAIEVEDRGLGLSDERLAEINRDLAEVPAFDLAEATGSACSSPPASPTARTSRSPFARRPSAVPRQS